MQFVSCGPERLYAHGGFYEDGTVAEPAALRTADGAAWLGELYPAYGRERAPLIHVDGEDPGFIERLHEHNRLIAAQYARGPSVGLVRFPRAHVRQSVIYRPRGGAEAGLEVVHETYRPNDRTAVTLAPQPVPEPGPAVGGDGRPRLYLGSAGSANYGHWLVDDLPRIKAADGLDPVFLLPSYGEQSDRVRLESLRAVSEAPVEWVDPNRLVACDDLLYATPVSYHPMLKSPEAMAWTRDRFAPARAEPPGRRLFVRRRRARARVLLNEAPVGELLAARGFEAIDPEGLSFAEQVQVFAQAACVVGGMGAAMTNALFCRPGTAVVHLAPNGWVEPFYADLAEVLGQTYAVLFGPVADGSIPPHTADFRVDLVRLAALLDAVAPG